MCSSNNELPARQTIRSTLLGTPGSPGSGSPFSDPIPATPSDIPYGEELLTGLFNRYKTGLPPELRDLYTRRGKANISGELEEGRQALTEALASKGGVPLDAKIRGNVLLQNEAGNKLNHLNDSLLEKDYNAQNDALAQLFQLFGIASGASGEGNQFNLSKYAIDEDSRFKLGDFLGSLLGAAGQVGSRFIPPK